LEDLNPNKKEVKHMKKGLLLVIAVVFLMVAPLQAAPMLTIGDTGSAGIIPIDGESNQILTDLFGYVWPNTSIGGYFGATLSVDGPAIVTIEFLGYESYDDNSFTYNYTGGGSTTWFNLPKGENISPSDPDIVDTLLGAGELDFFFSTEQGPVANGDANESDSWPNFFVSFNDVADGLGTTNAGPKFGTTAYVFLDDGGTKVNDDGVFVADNHDDFAIRITASQVPIPAAAWLLGVGLMGLVGIRRKISQ
jgi:hypothetical protein